MLWTKTFRPCEMLCSVNEAPVATWALIPADCLASNLRMIAHEGTTHTCSTNLELSRGEPFFWSFAPERDLVLKGTHLLCASELVKSPWRYSGLSIPAGWSWGEMRLKRGTRDPTTLAGLWNKKLAAMSTAAGQKTVIIIWILLATDFVDVLWLHGLAGSLYVSCSGCMCLWMLLTSCDATCSV